jgi:hypothetical protein
LPENLSRLWRRIIAICMGQEQGLGIGPFFQFLPIPADSADELFLNGESVGHLHSWG